MADSDVGALIAIEQQLGWRRPVFGRSFVRMDRWLVAPHAILARITPLRWRKAPLPRLEVSLSDWLRARRIGGSSRLALSCCALYEGRQSRRAFYLGRGLTIKLLPPGTPSGQVTRDVEARALIAASGQLHVPKVLASDAANDRTFIVEELIAGCHPSADQGDRILNELLPAIWTTYRALGLGTVESFAGMTMELIKGELEREQIPQEMTYERECRDELLRRLKQLPSTAEQPLITAFGHGDLSVGNIIMTGTGDLFVVDWETAGRMPIVWDLRKLMTTVPGLLLKAVQMLRAELDQPAWRGAMTAENQFLIGLGARVAERSRKAHRRGHSSADHKTLRALRRAGDCLHSGALQ